MRVIIWHNTDRRSRFFDQWQPGHTIERAYAYWREGTDPEAVLEDIFRENNNVTGDPDVEVSFRNHARSLSVGDVVQVGDRAWTVATIGFHPCPVPEEVI